MNSFPTLFDTLERPTSIYIANCKKTQNLFAFVSPQLYELVNAIPIIYLSIYITYQELIARVKTPGMLFRIRRWGISILFRFNKLLNCGIIAGSQELG